MSGPRVYVRAMGRVLVIVGLVAFSMLSGAAFAAPTEEVRLPVQVSRDLPAEDSVVVVEGDHLWKISARHLGPEAGDRRIAPYWRAVIEVNTATLQSGDPDLIYPGEVVQLPPVSEQP